MSLSDRLHIVGRDEWLARPGDPEVYQDKLIPPIPYVVIHHTVTSQCFSNIKCMQLVLSIQNYHISINVGDIGYNFLIGGNGYVYVGRNWGYVGAHTYPYNRCTIAIAFIGSFDNNEPTIAQMEALEMILFVGVKKGIIRKDYRLYCASTLMQTASPGKNLKERLKLLPHYSQKEVQPDHCIRRVDLNITENN